MKIAELGHVQLQIMKILWEKGQATAREVLDAMNENKRIADSTVRTLLRRLEKKGAVTHDVNHRTFIFRPLVQPESVRETATRAFVDRLFDGSAAGLVSYLLRHERISRKDLERIRRQIGEPEESAQ